MSNLRHDEITKSNLTEWISHLSEVEKIQFDSDLDDYIWHSVTDSNNDIKAIFQIINVRDLYAKNLSIRFHPQTDPNDQALLVDVISFIFNSIVAICSDQLISKIKFHTHDELMIVIFGILSQHHVEMENIKEAKRYGKWIEITLP